MGRAVARRAGERPRSREDVGRPVALAIAGLAVLLGAWLGFSLVARAVLRARRAAAHA